jgi:hypothetical protein
MLERPMVRNITVCLCLIAATLAVYWSVRDHDFVRYDDENYVFENQYVRQGLHPDAIQWALKSGHEANWHPVTWLSHMVDCELFGPDQPG